MYQVARQGWSFWAMAAVMSMSMGCLSAERKQVIDDHMGLLAGAKYFEPRVVIDFAEQFGSELNDQPGEFDLSSADIKFMLPVSLGDSSVLFLGAESGSRDYDFSGAFPGLGQDEILYQISLALGVGYFVSESLFVSAIFKPGVFSDFDGALGADDWRLLGHAIASLKLVNGILLRAGVKVGDEFDEVEVYPLLGLSLGLDSGPRFDVLLPVEAVLSYTFADDSVFYLGGNVEGEQYSWRLDNNVNQQNYDLRIQNIRARMGYLYRLTSSLSTYAEVGATIAGEYDIRNSTGIRIEETQDPAIFYAVGIGIDF